MTLGLDLKTHVSVTEDYIVVTLLQSPNQPILAEIYQNYTKISSTEPFVEKHLQTKDAFIHHYEEVETSANPLIELDVVDHLVTTREADLVIALYMEPKETIQRNFGKLLGDALSALTLPSTQIKLALYRNRHHYYFYRELGVGSSVAGTTSSSPVTPRN